MPIAQRRAAKAAKMSLGGGLMMRRKDFANVERRLVGEVGVGAARDPRQRDAEEDGEGRCVGSA